MKNIVFTPANELVEDIKSKKNSVVEVVTAFLNHIKENNPKVPLLATFMYAFIRLKYRDHLWAKGMALGQRLSNVKYAKAIDYKDEVSEVYDTFLTKHDIWITPVCSFEAYKHQRAG